MATAIFLLSSQYPCWDNILQHLDLNSVKHLRLASRQIATSCLTPRFLRHVERRTVELLPDDEGEALTALREHPLSAHVKHLTIITNVYDPSLLENSVRLGRLVGVGVGLSSAFYPVPDISGSVDDWRKQCDWMRERSAGEDCIPDEEIVGRLTETSKALKSLHSLSLDVRLCFGLGVYQPAYHTSDWPLVRRKASWLFDVVVAAIAESRVRIEEFDGYFDKPGCAVAIDSLAASLRRVGSDGRVTPWDGVRALSLRVCEEPVTGSDREIATCQRKGPWVDVLAGLFRTCAELESLSIHVYDPPEIQEHCEIFPFLAKAYSQRLKRCSLRHLPVLSADLKTFLTHQTNLEQLELSWIALLDADDWQPLLSELPRLSPKLQKLKLSCLTTSLTPAFAPTPGLEMSFMMSEPFTLGPGTMQNLETRWMRLGEKPRTEEFENTMIFDSLDCERGSLWHTMTFSAEDLRKGLDFLPIPGQLILSPQNWRLALEEVRDCRPKKVD
jgi:hypothetical protein